MVTYRVLEFQDMIRPKRLIKTFLELVKIDSISGKEQEIAKEVAKRLKALGGKVTIDKVGNVIGKFPGGDEPLMLNAHLDTVEPGRGIKPIIKGDKITSDGTTILGGDCKAGLAVILEALASLKEEKTKHLPIEIVFTVQEEINLAGSKNLDYSKLSSKRGLVFDGGPEAERIDISSPTYYRVDITIKGRSAHAGFEPEKGISVIQIAGHILSKLKLGRIDPETTANIGLIQGGSVRNAIPDLVQLYGEIRSRNPKKLEKHSIHFKNVVQRVLNKYSEASIDITIEKEIDGYLLKDDHKMLIFATNVLSQIELEPLYQHSGGLTDANIFHAKGIEVVTVGIGNHLAHTTREYVVIPEMLQSARFCEKAVKV